ncbi:unnamed protein product [Linum tenue]|uniref:DUF1995 domain-containing protein n=1 Tax=Linum tenue TaxID=586396 RepID=A0AAV0R495_9ROSI|nr:unnamed protein product [Linum tenue]
MAASIPSCSFHCNSPSPSSSSLPSSSNCSTTATPFTLSFLPSAISRSYRVSSRIRAKFEKFHGEEESLSTEENPPLQAQSLAQQQELRVKAIFPDAGAAALLKYRWKEAAFGFASEIVVMVVPDYQMLSSVEKITASLSDDPPRPLIMWNPRLISEDVGVGINVRNLRRYFLSTFTTVYSMRPLPEGAVFRLWKVFFDDKERPNRYLLAKEFIRRPDADDIEIIFGNGGENSEEGQSLFSQAASIFSSINRFMRVISK